MQRQARAETEANKMNRREKFNRARRVTDPFPPRAEVAPNSVPPNTASRSKVAHFASELNAIHSDNLLYWKCGAEATREARAEYRHKLDRVEEIRAALAKISSRTKPKETKRLPISATTEEFQALDLPAIPMDCESL
jgi:hypothetical protein